jgi:arabinan endo-1,5-alpha-L-arabinosidase
MKSINLLFLIILSIINKAYQIQYTNPVLPKDAPDPTVIKADNGLYYLYATGEGIYKSSNLVQWTYIRNVFHGKKRPSFVNVNSYWAPCITKQGNQYILYYALSVWGGINTAGIGVATSSSPEGPFDIKGNGKLFTSREIGVKNSIDPYFIIENNKKYIIWGSFHGIYAVELDNSGLKVKNLKNKIQLAGRAFEAPYIFKRGKYYYLFASIGSCCEGDRSRYQTVVGRSKNFRGPYLSKKGGKMLNNQYTVLLSGNKKFVGPGHNSRIITDKKGKTWMLYHAYIRGQSKTGRTVCLDEVKWTKDDWPYFDGNSPSQQKQNGPEI